MNHVLENKQDIWVITRHPNLVAYLVEKGYVDPNVNVISHATPEVVTGKHVIGVLPNHLSCLTESFTEVTLNIPLEKRGVELTIEDMREYAGKMTTYKVSKVFER